jgi:hypothetical protein
VRVVVSLTTLPGREDLVERTLHSLRGQVRRPDRVYVWLAEGRDYAKIPACEGLELSVARSPDRGPATKLIPTLAREACPDTLIITVDDDVVYPPRLLEKLVEAACLFPTCAIGFTGWQVIAPDGEPLIRHFNQEMTYCGFVHPVDVLEGTRGVLYRRSFFSDDVNRHLGSCDAFRYHDDIFFGGYLAHRGISKLVRWFDHADAVRVDGRWQIACQDSGLHMTKDWRRLGRQCWDYWGDAFARARGEPRHETLGPRLRITTYQTERGLSLRGSVSERAHSRASETATKESMGALAWPDGKFSELVVDAGIRDWKGIIGLTNELLRISAADAVISLAIATAASDDLDVSEIDALGADDGTKGLLRRAFTAPGVCAVDTALPGVRVVASGNPVAPTFLIVKGDKLTRLRAPRPDLNEPGDPSLQTARR